MEKPRIIGEAQNQPHDINTEQAVLATLMRYNELYSQYSDILNSGLFYYETEKAIYKAIEGVISEGGITDINSLTDYAQKHDLGYQIERGHFLDIFQLASTNTLEQDIKRLRHMAKQRSCWLLLQQAAQNVLDPMTDLDEIVNGTITALSEVQSEINDDGIADFDNALADLQEIIKNNSNGNRIYLKTGFRLFDDYFLLRPSTLTIIAAFTSVGKTALALNITKRVAMQNIPVAYYSLEMGKAELASRLISKQAETPASILMNKPLMERQRHEFNKAAEEIRRLPIYIDERSTISFERTIRSIRTMVKTRNIKLAVIDYLQIYTQVADNVESNLAYMARSAKNIAKELNIAVVVLSQLNRSGLHPNIKMLRGSGQIEESADNIVLIDRPEAYPDNSVTKYEGEFKEISIVGTAKLILSKGRGVGTGCSLVGFESQYTRFYERDELQTHNEEQEDNLPF